MFHICVAILALLLCMSVDRSSLSYFLLQAGKTLKFLSSAVPVVSGLAGLAASALKAGDRYLQTRRVSKVSLFHVYGASAVLRRMCPHLGSCHRQH